MAYKMKGPSLLKMVSALKKKDEYPTEEDKKFLKEQNEESVHAMDYLTKTPVGPRVKKKKVKKGQGLEGSDIPLSPGFEDPIKIQKLQREGLIPSSQKFGKKK